MTVSHYVVSHDITWSMHTRTNEDYLTLCRSLKKVWFSIATYLQAHYTGSFHQNCWLCSPFYWYVAVLVCHCYPIFLPWHTLIGADVIKGQVIITTCCALKCWHSDAHLIKKPHQCIQRSLVIPSNHCQFCLTGRKTVMPFVNWIQINTGYCIK